MLIESLIKPSNQQVRNITLFGKLYRFTPVLPGRFVAEVSDAHHASTFLANPAYREFTETLPSATLTRAAQSPAPPIEPPAPPVVPKDELPSGEVGETLDGEDDGEGEDAGDDDTSVAPPPADGATWPTAVADEAATLLRNSPSTLGAAIGRVTSLDVLRCALALEQSKIGRQKPRTAVIGLIEAALRDAAAAGVR